MIEKKSDDYEILYQRYSALLKERLALFTLFLFITTTLSIAAFYTNPEYGICDAVSNERIIVLICLGLFMIFVWFLFFLMLNNTNYFIKESMSKLATIREVKTNNLAPSYFERETNNCCISHGYCFNILLAMAAIGFILMLVFMGYKSECSSPTPPECVKCQKGDFNKINIDINFNSSNK